MEIIGKQDSLKALRIQDLLEKDYLPYFTNLQMYYEREQIDDGDFHYVRSTRGKIQRAFVLIARSFLGAGNTASTQSELDELNQKLGEIETAKNYLIEKVPQQGALHNALKQATELTGIDPASMNLSVAISRKARKQHKERAKVPPIGIGGMIGGTIGSIGSMLGLGRWGLAGAAGISQMLAPLLGPLFLPGMAAGLGVKALLKGGSRLAGRGARWAHSKTVGQGRPAYSPAVASPMAEPAYTPPQQTLPATPIMPKIAPDPGGHRLPVDRVLPATRGLSAVRQMSNRELHNATLPLWYFFNRLAYKARWTKDVLRALKGKGVKSKGGFGSGFAGAFLGAGGLLLAAKFIALAGVVTAATLAISKLVPKVGEWWKTLGVVQKAGKKARVDFKTKIDIKRTEDISAVRRSMVIPEISKEHLIERIKKTTREQYREFLVQQNESLPWELKNVSPTFKTNPENIFWNENNWLRQAWEWVRDDLKYGGPQKEGARRQPPRKGTVYTPVPGGFFDYNREIAPNLEIPETPEHEVPPVVGPPTPTTAPPPLTDYEKQQVDVLEKILQAILTNPAALLGEPPITGPYDSLEGDPFMQRLNADGADSLPRR